MLTKLWSIATCPKPPAQSKTTTDLVTGSKFTTGARASRAALRRGLCAVRNAKCINLRDLISTAYLCCHHRLVPVQHPQVHQERRVSSPHPVPRHSQSRINPPVLCELRAGKRYRRGQRRTQPNGQDPRCLQGFGPRIHRKCELGLLMLRYLELC